MQDRGKIKNNTLVTALITDSMITASNSPYFSRRLFGGNDTTTEQERWEKFKKDNPVKAKVKKQ